MAKGGPTHYNQGVPRKWSVSLYLFMTIVDIVGGCLTYNVNFISSRNNCSYSQIAITKSITKSTVFALYYLPFFQSINDECFHCNIVSGLNMTKMTMFPSCFSLFLLYATMSRDQRHTVPANNMLCMTDQSATMTQTCSVVSQGRHKNNTQNY